MKEENFIKKEEIKEKHKINNEDTKNNIDNDNTDKYNNNYSNKEIEIKNKIKELKIISKDNTGSNGAFPDNCFNTIKPVIN